MCVLGYNLLVALGLILGAVILHERGLQAEASTQVTATHFARVLLFFFFLSLCLCCCFSCCLRCRCCCCCWQEQVLDGSAKGLMCVGGCNHSNRKSGEKSFYMVFVTAFYLSLSLSAFLSAISLSLVPRVLYFVACCRCQRCINFIKSDRPLKGALPCIRCYP